MRHQQYKLRIQLFVTQNDFFCSRVDALLTYVFLSGVMKVGFNFWLDLRSNAI